MQHGGALENARHAEAGAVTRLRHEKTMALVWGTEPPVFSIGWGKPLWPGDSGFTVLFDDAPDRRTSARLGIPRSRRLAFTA
jgi:hypothetical protein